MTLTLETAPAANAVLNDFHMASIRLAAALSASLEMGTVALEGTDRLHRYVEVWRAADARLTAQVEALR